MGTFKRKAQPTIEAIRLPRRMKIEDGVDRKGRPQYVIGEAGDYLVTEGDTFYVLSENEFAEQFEEEEQEVIRHRKGRQPQHVSAQDALSGFYKMPTGIYKYPSEDATAL